MTRRPAPGTQTARSRPFVQGKIRQAARIRLAATEVHQMRRMFMALLFITTTALSAQDLRQAGSWSPIAGGGCIGGSTCPERRLRLPIEDRPIVGVRFRAH